MPKRTSVTTQTTCRWAYITYTNRKWTSNVTTANKSVTFNFLKHSSRDTHGYMTQIIITQNTNRLWRSQTPNKISWSQKLRIGCIQLTVLESDAQLKTLAANQHRNKRTRIKRNGFFSQHNHKKYANCYNLPHLRYTTDKHSFTHWYNTNTTNHGMSKCTSAGDKNNIKKLSHAKHRPRSRLQRWAHSMISQDQSVHSPRKQQGGNYSIQ